jgi:molecular chaperone HtpG
MATHEFQTEVKDLLQLIIHSLYSHKEIFLRELVSNASDALDKLKYLTVTDEAFKGLEFEPRIDIRFDEEAKLLSVADDGIGMSAAELTENLGTIARSGTRRFLESLGAEARKDSNLIGQFGVGFYSAFMVADRIEVYSRKAGQAALNRWSSEGKGSFDVDEVDPATLPASAFPPAAQGSTIVLHLNEEGREYASRWAIQDIVRKYSNHIAFPIWLHWQDQEYDNQGKKKGKPKPMSEQINSANALWRRPKSELTEKDYEEFYKSISHDDDEPLHYIHTHAEGSLEYSTLFYFPKKAPFDLYYADYRPGVKLYVRRVFITDDDKDLLPPYLRFVRGVIDSEDLPLNVSREILQRNKILVNIRQASVKKILGEIKTMAESNPAKYAEFIKEFNRPLKEGLFSDFMNREALLEVVRFKSSSVDGLVSLADYKSRMKEGQKAVYYLTGADEARLRASPLLEAYRKQGIEVLLMDDEIDAIVVPSLGRYGDLELKPINQSGADEDLGIKEDKAVQHDFKETAARLAKALGDEVKDVRVSARLSDSPSCLVSDKDDPGFQVREMMRAMGQRDVPEVKPILEINPSHPLVLKAKDTSDEAALADIAQILLVQARLVEGLAPRDPADFVRRLNRLISGT